MTYLVNIQFTAPHLVLSDWDKLFDCCSCKCLWQQKGDMLWCADPFLFRPAQYSCPYHRQVVVWRDDLWCSQSLSAVTTDLPQCGWLPQCFCIHTVSSAHFPQLNVQDDYSPGGLCLNMSVRRSTLIFGCTTTKWGPALKESLWLTNWVSDKVMQFYHWPVKCKSTELAIYLTLIFWSPSCWKLADPCPWLVDSCISTFTCSCEIIVLYRIHLQLHPLFVNPELR